MDAAEFRQRGKEMVDYIADYMENIHTRRVLPEVQPGYLREMLPAKAPRKGEAWEDIMKDVNRAIMPGITHWQHPRFHAYFPAGNSYPSILGDMLSDAIGCIGFSWAASPACTELEIIVLDWLAKMIGLPPVFMHEHGLGGGVIQGSASDCVLVSLLAARHAALKDLKDKFPYMEESILLSKLVGYCSKMAHSCVEKAGMISLVKMRELEVDENLSLRGSTLQKAIEEDRRMGLVPFYVCATLGTTAACSFDNLAEMGLVCERETVWLHVDAAYAGCGFICPEFQHFIKGIEHANSFNTNPSKWMLVNFDCSTMWVRDRKVLTQALTVDPLYLQHSHSAESSEDYNDKAVDFRHWGIPLSRRFRALKLWFVIRTYGVEGLQKYMREHVRLAKQMEQLVRNDSRFEVTVKVHMGLVCFRLQGGNYRTQTLLRAINMSGKLHMVPALVHDKYVIRFAVNAQKATSDDILYAWNVISEMAGEVIEACNSNKASEEAIERLASLDLEDVEEDPTAVIEDVVNHHPEKGELEEGGRRPQEEEGDEEEEEVFLYDDNIPSIPSLPMRYEMVARAGVDPHKRRNLLLRMISDPKCYNPRVLRSLSQEGKEAGKRRLSESPKSPKSRESRGSSGDYYEEESGDYIM